MADDIARLGLEVDSRQLKDAIKRLDQLEAQSGKTEKATRNLSGAYTALGGVVTALGLGALVSRTVSATAAQEKAMVQLRTAVESTGGAAGYTADELRAMAQSMQKVTTYGDESVMAMQSVLLTFTKIGEETFPRANMAILDMATRLGMDLQSAAIQVGKALNDPILGVTSLSRAGVQFTEDQKDMIKAMVEGGKAAEAQALILSELETQFGGSAKAAKDTLGGALQSLGNAFGDLFESDEKGITGTKKALNDLTATFADPNVKRTATAVTDAIFTGFEYATKALNTLILTFQDLGDTVGAYAAAIGAVLSLEFDQASEILDMREKEKELFESKLENIWAQKKATEELIEKETKLQETQGTGGAGAATATDEEDKKREKLEREAEALRQSLLSEEQAIIDSYLRREELIEQLREEGILSEEEYLQRRYDLNAKYDDEMLAHTIAKETQEAAFLKKTTADKTKTVLGSLGEMARGVSSQNKLMFNANKALALANAAIALPDAVLQSFRNAGGYPWGLIPAAAMAAQGMAQISSIRSASFGGGGGGGASVGGGAASAASPSLMTPSAAGGVQTEEPEQKGPSRVELFVQGVFSAGDVRDLIGQINEQVGDGVELKATVTN